RGALGAAAVRFAARGAIQHVLSGPALAPPLAGSPARCAVAGVPTLPRHCLLPMELLAVILAVGPRNCQRDVSGSSLQASPAAKVQACSYVNTYPRSKFGCEHKCRFGAQI